MVNVCRLAATLSLCLGLTACGAGAGTPVGMPPGPDAAPPPADTRAAAADRTSAIDSPPAAEPADSRMAADRTAADGPSSADLATAPKTDLAPASDGAKVDDPDGGPVHEVTVENYKFTPLKFTIHVGDEVKWISTPGVEPGLHWPTSGMMVNGQVVEDGVFKAPDRIGPGHLKSWSFRFLKAGVYPYLCTNNASHYGQTQEHGEITVIP